jgi:hypothetical protein
MYIAGTSLLSVAALLLGLFNRRVFFGDGNGPGFVDFSRLFYLGNWLGFWCAVSSLVCFWVSASQTRIPLVSRRALAPAIAVSLCAYFVIFSIPEESNKNGWKRGAVGLRVYWETKRRLWTEYRADARLKGAFQGKWKTAEGALLAIQEGQILITEPGKVTEFNETNCADSAWFRYQIADRQGVGYHFYRAGMLQSSQFLNLPEAPYPVLTYTCNGRDAAFMVLGDRRLVAILYDGSQMAFTK